MILFLIWGIIIISGSVWLICRQQKQLLRFSRRIARKTVLVYPTRAEISDSSGQRIAWTQWQFFIQVTPKRKNTLKRFLKALQYDGKITYSAERRLYFCDIPENKSVDAVKLAEKFSLRVRRRIVRKRVPLSAAGRLYVGDTLLYYGMSGAEKKYNAKLQGRCGQYMFMQGPLGRIDQNSLRVLLPVQSGEAIRLPLSLAELQCGLFIPEIY